MDTSVDGLAFLGAFLVLGTTGWMLYELNITRKVKKGVRENAVIEVAMLVRLRNAATVVLLYSLSFVCFLTVSLPTMSEASAEHQTRTDTIMFFGGFCVTNAIFVVISHVAQHVVLAHMKQKVRRRAWRLKFWPTKQKAKNDNLAVHD